MAHFPIFGLKTRFFVGFDWVRFASFRRSVSTGRVVETIGADRTFPDIFGYRRRVMRLCILTSRSRRTRNPRPLSLPPRCASVVTKAQRARATATNPSVNHGKIFVAVPIFPAARAALSSREMRSARVTCHPAGFAFSFYEALARCCCAGLSLAALARLGGAVKQSPPRGPFVTPTVLDLPAVARLPAGSPVRRRRATHNPPHVASTGGRSSLRLRIRRAKICSFRLRRIGCPRRCCCSPRGGCAGSFAARLQKFRRKVHSRCCSTSLFLCRALPSSLP